MFKYKLITLGIVMLLCYPKETNAQTTLSGFFPKKNKFAVATSYTYKSFDNFYRGKTLTDGNPANLGSISFSITSVYGEYGVNDWLSAVVTIPYISVKSGEGINDPVQNASQLDGIQDISTFLKARFFNQTFNDSSKLEVGGATSLTIPLGSYNGNGILSLGNNATTVDGFVIAQYTTNFNFFTEFQTGYSIRNNTDFKIPNAMLYSFKIGYYNDWIYAHAKLGTQDSLSGYDIGSPEFVTNNGPTALSQTQVDYTNLYFDVYVPVYKKEFGISTGYGVNLDGRNFNNEEFFSIGLVYKN